MEDEDEALSHAPHRRTATGWLVGQVASGSFMILWALWLASVLDSCIGGR